MCKKSFVLLTFVVLKYFAVSNILFYFALRL